MDNDTALRIRELKSEIEYYEDLRLIGEARHDEFLNAKIVFLRSEMAKIEGGSK